MPFDPFNVSLDCSLPNWSRAANAGAFCPTDSPIPSAEPFFAGFSCPFARTTKPVKNNAAAKNFIHPPPPD